jgi:hypothetical protein
MNLKFKNEVERLQRNLLAYQRLAREAFQKENEIFLKRVTLDTEVSRVKNSQEGLMIDESQF